MKFCVNCGKPNDDNAMFCVVCGAKQNVDAAPSQPQNANNNSGQINLAKDNGSISNVQENLAQNNQQNSFVPNNQQNGFAPNNQQNGFAPNNMQNNFAQNNAAANNQQNNFEPGNAQNAFAPNNMQNGSGQDNVQNNFAQGNYTEGFVNPNMNQNSNPNDPNEQQFNQFGQPQQPVKKKSKAPLIIGLSVGIVAVITAIVLVIVFAGGGGKNSAEGIAKSYLNALTKLDMKKMASCMAYSSEYKEEFEDDFDELDEDLSYLSAIKFTYKISSTKKLSKSAAEDFWDDYEWDVYVDEDDVKELTLVKAKITMTFMGEKDTEDIDIYVGKYKGKWKVIYSDGF